MPHKCDRNDCSPTSINGPKVKCAKCNSFCFLRCSGFEYSQTVGDNQTIQCYLPNGCMLSTSLSHLVFVCCSDTSPSTEQKSQVDVNKVAQLEQKLEDYENKIKALEVDLNEKCDLIESLTDSNESPDKLNVNDGQKNGLKSVPNESQTDPIDTQNALLNEVKSMLSSELLTLSEKITTECKKVKKFCSNKLNDIEAKMISKQNPFRVNAQENSGEQSQMYDENNNEVRKVIFNDGILPVAQRANKSVADYELHVSKFDINTKIDAIIEHVMQHTSIIDPNDFMVEKLGKPGADFASFKISTISNEFKEEIMSIWSPNYAAREFQTKQNKKNGMNNGLNKFRVSNAERKPKFGIQQNHRVHRSENSHMINTGYRNHTPAKYNTRRSDESRWHTQSRVNGRECYDTPKRKMNRSDQMMSAKKNEVHPTTQYIYIPYQQQMPTIQQPQTTFFVQPPGQHQMPPPQQTQPTLLFQQPGQQQIMNPVQNVTNQM